MAQRVYVSAWEAESYVEDGATLHTEDDPIGDAVEFLLLPAEDAERVRTLILLLHHSSPSDAVEALKLLEPNK